MNPSDHDSWFVYDGSDGGRDADGLNLERLRRLPEPPPWRRFERLDRARARNFRPEPDQIEKVNAALYLRRPLLITGTPGTGKTTLVYAVARELGLGPVLRWSITSRSTLQDGLYQYDAVARMQNAYLAEEWRRLQPDGDGGQGSGGAEPAPKAPTDPADIGPYLTLGPLGTAFFANASASDGEPVRYYPRVLLIDEIDKSDIDLPNDLLHVFEEGRFEVPELVRLKGLKSRVDVRAWGADAGTLEVINGEVPCREFPLVVMTSNGEREFPPAFRRRCLQLRIQPPGKAKLEQIVRAHLFAAPRGADDAAQAQAQARWSANQPEIERLIEDFLRRRDKDKQQLATDQLLNAIALALSGVDVRGRLLGTVMAPLSGEPGEPGEPG